MEFRSDVATEFRYSSLDCSMDVFIGGKNLKGAPRKFFSDKAQCLVECLPFFGTHYSTSNQTINVRVTCCNVDKSKLLVIGDRYRERCKFRCHRSAEPTVPEGHDAPFS